MSKKSGITRRNFLKLTATTTAGAVLTACTGAPPQSGQPSQAQPAAESSDATATAGLPKSGATQVFKELEPPPEPPKFEGGPKWTPRDLSGKTIVLWGIQYDPHVERYKLLGQTFEKRTGAKVDVQPQEGDLGAKFMSASAAGTAPDVVCYMGISTPPLVRQKAILPIDTEVFTPLGIDVEKWWRPGAIGAYTGDGQHWGVPHEDNWDGYTVTTRSDLVEAAGDGAKALWPGSKGEDGVWFKSYDDMFALAEMLQQKDDKGGMKLWGLNSSGWEPHSLFSIMRSLDTFWWDPENQKFNMDSDAAVKAIELLVEKPFKLGIEGVLGMSQINAFVGGQVALARGNGTAAGEAWKLGIEGENVIAPPPIEGKTPLFVGEGGWGWVLPSQAKDKDASAEFLRFACTYEAQYIFSQIYGGSPPATWGILDSDIYTGDHPVKVGLRRIVKALENCVFFGWGFGTWGTVSQVTLEALTAVREGKLKGPEAAKQMQDGFTEQLKLWQSEA